jgi:hypothetical protein
MPRPAAASWHDGQCGDVLASAVQMGFRESIVCHIGEYHYKVRFWCGQGVGYRLTGQVKSG